MECASCGTRLDDAARFCSGCGQPIALQRRAAVNATERRATAPPLPRQEIDAAIATRHELGERMEPEIVDAFLSRVEHAIDARVEERLRGRGLPGRGKDAAARAKDDAANKALGLALGSCALGIPLTAIAAGTTGLPGLVVAWAGIAIVNLAYNQRRRD